MMKHLKSLLIAAVLFVGMSQTVSAQAKVAHINVEELMTAMPEMKAANTQLENYGKTFETEYKAMVEEYQAKIKKYDQEAATVSDAINETRTQEVQEMGARIQQYQQNAGKEIQKKREEILKPILEKAKNAIQKVAKDKGYQYVLDSTVGSGVIVAEGPDLMADVKKELKF